MSVEYDGLRLGLYTENGNHRWFRHYEPSTGEVRRYSARVYGGAGASLGYFGWLAQDRWSWWIGADYFRSLLFSSSARRIEQVVDTTAERIDVSTTLLWHPYGTALALGPISGVGALGFDFAMPEVEGIESQELELATGNYDYVRVGLSTHYRAAPFTLTVGGSHLRVVETGRFGNRQVDAQPLGGELNCLLGVDLASWLGLSLRSTGRLLLFELAPHPARPGEQPAAVRDAYLSFALGVEGRL
ncbi:MAG: hypothetical protein OEZ06_17130 [Myxococcales bacterium]|nr:hypothetical protein [Myxococcales bacterium]